jgi:hypothetical protein
MSATIHFRFSVFPICHLKVLRMTYTKLDYNVACDFGWVLTDLLTKSLIYSLPCFWSSFKVHGGRSVGLFALAVQRFAGGSKMILLFIYALGKRGLRQLGVGDIFYI